MVDWPLVVIAAAAAGFGLEGAGETARSQTPTAPDAALPAPPERRPKREVTTFTDNDFHNIGIGIIRHNVVALAHLTDQLIKSGNADAIDRAAVATDFSALGRFLIPQKKADIAAFKTPDIRKILVTGPYFHDGSQETLGCHRPLQQGRLAARPVSRRRHSAGDRRSRRLPRIADERAVSGTGGEGTGAPA
jgi:hypothetical protein